MTSDLQHKKLLKKQRDIIVRRWPDLWHTLSELDVKEEIEYIENGLQSTFLVNGIHLSSCFNRVREAELQSSLIPVNANHAWIYGCGTGDLPIVLLKRENLQFLNVVLLNKSVFKSSLGYFDHHKWLTDTRVQLHLAADQNELNTPFCSSVACLKIAELEATRIADLVSLELNTAYLNEQFQNNESVKQQIEENKSLVMRDKSVTQLFGTANNSTIIVIGAGATLEDNYEYLKARNKTTVLIAVDAALRSLVNNTIYPDYVISIDPMRHSIFEILNVDQENLKNTGLVYFPVVGREVLENWKGKRFVAYSDSPVYNDVANIKPGSQLFSHGSVIHSAVDLAVKIGASRIELFGADFSFTKNKTHVSGAYYSSEINSSEIQAWIQNGYGQQIPTLTNLRSYLRDLERYISANPGVTFLNASREGAYILGTKYLNINEVTAL